VVVWVEILEMEEYGRRDYWTIIIERDELYMY